MKRTLLVGLMVVQMGCWLVLLNNWTGPAPTAIGSFTVHPTIDGRPLAPGERKVMRERYAQAFTSSDYTLVSFDDRPNGDTVIRFSATGDQIPSLLYFLSSEVYRSQLSEQARLGGSQACDINSAGSGPLAVTSSTPAASIVKYVGFFSALLVVYLAVRLSVIKGRSSRP